MNMGSNLGGLISPALTPVIASMIGWEKLHFMLLHSTGSYRSSLMALDKT